MAAEGPDPAVRAGLLADADRVREALARLPEKQRLAVTLRVYQGLSYKEVGAVAGCSEGAARVHYHFAMKRLREWLQ
mgnify:CR=1 FL=1